MPSLAMSGSSFSTVSIRSSRSSIPTIFLTQRRARVVFVSVTSRRAFRLCRLQTKRSRMTWLRCSTV